MQNATALKSEIEHHSRAARNILAKMGSRKWTPKDQEAFDRTMDDAERAQDRLDSVLVASGQEAAVSAQYRDGLDIFLRKSIQQMTPAERQKMRNTMSTTTSSQGGYSVAPMVASELVNLLKGYGFMRQVAAQLTTTTGADLTFPTSDGTAEAGELITQNTTATSLDPSFGSAPIPTYKFSSKIFTVPFELLQDSNIDIVAMVMQRMRDRIGRTQNGFFTTGTSTGQPTGLVTNAAVGKTGTTGQTLTVIYDDLVDLVDSLDVAYLGMPDKQDGVSETAPGWMFAQATRKVIRKIKDTAGRPIWIPSVGGALPQMLDAPVYINNDMPVPAASAKSIAFGDLGSYMVRDVLDVVMHRFEDSAYTKLGQVGFLGWARAGGNLMDTGAIKLYQHSST